MEIYRYNITSPRGEVRGSAARGNMSIKRARNLRRDQTKPEDIFWNEVRNRNFLGLKFRRQVPIDKYIADFVCEQEKLIIELDGDQHAENEISDEYRTQILESHG